VFVSRRCDRVKILTWDKGGLVLLYKRLERGQFKLPHMDPSAMAVQMDATPLTMLLDGIDVGRVRRPQHRLAAESKRHHEVPGQAVLAGGRAHHRSLAEST